MNRRCLRLLLWFAALWLAGGGAWAHVGMDYVVFEGRAGRFPVRVVVRQPEVVPGLAEINVRVLSGDPERVTALPLHWTTDRSGAPRPDVAQLVPGETNLFNAELWFMARGAYGVEVAVEGSGGGTLMVPVNSLARAQKPLPRPLGLALAGLGGLLVAGFIAIVAGAVREGTLRGELTVSRQRRAWSWVAGVAGLALAAGALYGGARWWQAEENVHQTRVMFRPFEQRMTVQTGDGRRELRLELTDPRALEPRFALMPDHGKLVHLFLVGEGAQPAFAHLHPVRNDDGSFRATLPPLPAGIFQVFTDLTHELGLTQTLTNSLTLAKGTGASAYEPSDSADSWHPPSAPSGTSADLGDGLTMRLELEGTPRPGQPVGLRARILDATGQSAPLEPYLRMLGHAAVASSTGDVFAHLHPAGTLSMAAARRFAAKAGGEDAARASDVNCGDLEAVPPSVAATLTQGGEVTFPFVFPRAGEYRVWVQVRAAGKIRTGLFRVPVAAARP